MLTRTLELHHPVGVVGDSTTRTTQKYDGPYFVIQWLLRKARVAVIPVVDDTKRVRFNAVPRDVVIDAITWLSGRAESLSHGSIRRSPRRRWRSEA